jgi:hypothetical protein
MQDVPDRCVDEVHWLTEREYQKLIARLNTLEIKFATTGGKDARKP